MGTSTMILTSKNKIPWTDEEPQTNAKNAYVCYPLIPPARMLQAALVGHSFVERLCLVTPYEPG